MAVATGKVKDRRRVELPDVAALLAEVERLGTAARAGRARTLGNWTVAQIFDHLAIAMEFAYTKPPFNPPLVIKAMARVGKAINYRGTVRMMLKPGLKLPPSAAAMEPPVSDDLDRAQARLRKAAERIGRGEPATYPNALLGELTPEQLQFLHLTHAEMHLSFVRLD